MNVLRKTFQSNKKQCGTVIIEFAIIAMLFFTMLLAIMEFGRVFYLWNTAQEVTRRAARDAIVRNWNEASAIQCKAIFQPDSAGCVNGLPAAGSIINGSHVKITYLRADGESSVNPAPSNPKDNLSACNDAKRQGSCIRFVRAEICQSQGNNNNCGAITYTPMVGLFPFLAVNIPVSAVTMPAESLGL